MVELNSHGVNKAIKAHILSDEEMKSVGFRMIKGDSQRSDYWYYSCLLEFLPPYNKSEISFSVSIPMDGSDISIDILDEEVLQPYDYQYIIENVIYHTFSSLVKMEVEEEMKRLQDLGVLSGHEYGEYI